MIRQHVKKLVKIMILVAKKMKYGRERVFKQLTRTVHHLFLITESYWPTAQKWLHPGTKNVKTDCNYIYNLVHTFSCYFSDILVSQGDGRSAHAHCGETADNMYSLQLTRLLDNKVVIFKSQKWLFSVEQWYLLNCEVMTHDYLICW